jgi:hypothetical protein
MKKHHLAVGISTVLLVLLAGCDEIIKPDLPVVVTQRPSLAGQGLVAQFNNQTNSQLTVSLVFENKRSNQRKEGSINIPPNGTVEIGWLEGWMFEPGETVTLSHPNYKTKKWSIP